MGSDSREEYGYVKSHFDVTGFCSNNMSDNPSLVGRMGNLLNTAVNSMGKKIFPFPKLIIVVPDDDFIKNLQEKGVESGSSVSYGRLINYVMTEHERGISSFKENLPAKSKRDGYPHILWILAPNHTNFRNNVDRDRFNRCVEDQCKFHTNVSCLELKKVWDPQDENLFFNDRFTADGLRCYWTAVDRTIRYCDTVSLKKKFAKIKQQPKTGKKLHYNKDTSNQSQNDIYRWRNPNISADVAKFKSYKKLTCPPGEKILSVASDEEDLFKNTLLRLLYIFTHFKIFCQRSGCCYYCVNCSLT